MARLDFFNFFSRRRPRRGEVTVTGLGATGLDASTAATGAAPFVVPEAQAGDHGGDAASAPDSGAAGHDSSGGGDSGGGGGN